MSDLGNEIFDKISDKLNTTYDPEMEIKDLSKELDAFEDKKKELLATPINQIRTIEEKEEIEKDLKSLIEYGKDVLKILKEDLRIGSEARKFEVFAQMLNSTSGALKELIAFKKMIYDIQVFQDPQGPIPNQSPGAELKIKMTGKELAKLIIDAEKNNSLNNIDAKFNVDRIVDGEFVEKKGKDKNDHDINQNS